MDGKKIEQAVTMILEAIGENPTREGLRDTPKRVAQMYQELFSGLAQDPQSVITSFIEEQYEEMILVKDISLYSICEHHLLPFYGKAHVAYLPRKGRVTGLSKLVKVVEMYAKRPQMQERLTSQIADCIVNALDPLGVLVVVEAEHMCMTVRGVKKTGSLTVTSAVRGAFRTNGATRAEALFLIQNK
jgi:GTP cyclohydrolase I